VTTPENPPRWAPDPLGRHQYRYWDGMQWTEHVSDDGLVATDPPAAGPAPSTGQFGGEPDPGAAGYAAPAAGFGATHLGTPLPAPGTGTGASASAPASAWSQVTPQYDATAVLGRRYGAFLIDAAVCLAAFALFFFPFATERSRAETLALPGCHLSASDSSMVQCDNRFVVTVDDRVYEADLAAFLGLSVLFTFLYFALAEGLFAGSLGKYLTGIRVVGASGNRIGVPKSMARWALFAIDGPLSLFLCGIIMSSVTKGHQRLGDRAAGSYVVARADADRPVDAR
jgi:uncharacterized RDD family membrane protein YckC